jgi:hypothetical protein
VPTYATDGLLTAARREAFLPDASDQSDADLLAFADDVLATLVSAAIVEGRDGRWLARADTSITPGVYSYAEPTASLGQAVRGVAVVKPDGVEYSLTPTDSQKLAAMASGATRTSEPWWYAFEAGQIVLSGVSATPGWTLRVYYVRTPPKLIPTSEGSAVVGVGSSNELSLATDPDATTMAVGALVNVVSGIEPYPTLFAGLEVATNAALYLDFTTAPFTAGSPSIPPAQVQNVQPAYVVPAGTTVYPPIPRSMWPALVRGTCAAALSAVRDPGAPAMLQRAMEARQQAIEVMMPRDTRRSRAIVGASALRTTPGWGGRRWR